MITHPDTGGIAEVAASSLPQHFQAGWTRLDEAPEPEPQPGAGTPAPRARARGAAKQENDPGAGDGAGAGDTGSEA